MDIKLDDDYKIKSDKRQYILGQVYEYESKGEKKTRLKDKTFHRTITSVLNAYIEKRLKTDEDISSFSDLVEKIYELKTNINKIGNEIENAKKMVNVGASLLMIVLAGLIVYNTIYTLVS